MANHHHDPQVVSQGVDALINRLRQEGVETGQQQADEILANAKAEARKIIEQAKVEAKERIDEAVQEADNFLLGGTEALKTACRDMVLTMKAQLTESFKADVSRLVEEEMEKPELMRQMILELVGKAKQNANIGDTSEVEVILPADVVGLEEIQNSPTQFENSPLTEVVFGLTQELLKEGVTFAASEDLTHGLQIRLVNRDLILDFSEQSVAEMLMQHLQPRFRAILEGVVR